MNTPICDFVRDYAGEDTLRLHMPGHKGVPGLGMERLDITEIAGADSLYEAEGIIGRSEKNASDLFGCETFYSTEGSSQCIRAMLLLAALHAKARGETPLIAAARNVHKTFLSAAALLELDVMWLYPRDGEAYLSWDLSAEDLERRLREMPRKPTAVYLTSPDYLGGMADVEGIARVCHALGCLLLVDCAHGAYLRFLPESWHPVDLGADLCCTSAHKTLPVLTGGAYLHLGAAVSRALAGQVKTALALFGSTSPSYLILQSLDRANPYLEQYPEILREFLPLVARCRGRLEALGWELRGQEPMKLTLATKSFGYSGTELARELRSSGIEPEFADPDYLVLMPTPQTGEQGLLRLEAAFEKLPRRAPIKESPPQVIRGTRVISIREAMLSPSQLLPVEQCAGRILAEASVGCPPAVPILVCGERITPEAIAAFHYYGIAQCRVISPKEG